METKERTAGILGRVESMVSDFVATLAKADPNQLDCLELEKTVMNTVCELGLRMMKEVFLRADEQAPEIVIHGERWGNRTVTKGTYWTKYGSFPLERSGYQQSGRGHVAFAVDLRLGLVEGRYTPGLARVMAPYPCPNAPEGAACGRLPSAGIRGPAPADRPAL